MKHKRNESTTPRGRVGSANEKGLELGPLAVDPRWCQNHKGSAAPLYRTLHVSQAWLSYLEVSIVDTDIESLPFQTRKEPVLYELSVRMAVA